MGRSEFFYEEFNVVLAHDFKSNNYRRNFVYVNLIKEDGVYYAHKIGSQSSNQLMTISKANGVIIMSEDMKEIQKGDTLNGRFIFK